MYLTFKVTVAKYAISVLDTLGLSATFCRVVAAPVSLTDKLELARCKHRLSQLSPLKSITPLLIP